MAEKEAAPYHQAEKRSALYAQPISDNIDFTRDLKLTQKRKSILTARLYHLVERMVEGYYKVVEDEILFISKKKREDGFAIPLHLASHSARALADLYFYLKHVVKPGQIIIIDEPESHLSPKNQILMTRLLAFCANSGLKVLITTHSDYIIKEINNLIMLSIDFPERKEFLQDYKEDYTEADRLDLKDVKAYICEDGTLRQCTIGEKGINSMTVFDDTIRNINRVSAQLSLYTDMMDDSDDE